MHGRKDPRGSAGAPGYYYNALILLTMHNAWLLPPQSRFIFSPLSLTSSAITLVAATTAAGFFVRGVQWSPDGNTLCLIGKGRFCCCFMAPSGEIQS